MILDSDNKGQGPEISIDEALELFLSIAGKGDIPEGEERNSLIETLKEKIAQDRPEWAAASDANDSDERDTAGPETYSEVKARLVREANKEEVPEDPDERYLHNRRMEARKNREDRQVDDREARIKGDLRTRLISEKKDANEETLAKALLARKALEERLKELFKPQFDEATDRQKQDNSLSPAHVQFSEKWNARLSSDDKPLAMQERLQMIREYNDARRQVLTSTETTQSLDDQGDDSAFNKSVDFKSTKGDDAFTLSVDEAPYSRPASRADVLKPRDFYLHTRDMDKKDGASDLFAFEMTNKDVGLKTSMDSTRSTRKKGLAL